ncbi:hypothetical protein Acr_23g0016190 [Actinidia rufa]|uniref:Uncharacterized protein n=1 Tax=Actinidia rufa TaxID=165716 RepID=A0A7J0GRH3_9ERIC|nr:hypothetical protein Acr_23g0016190 [Actinidia rufa]
MGGALLSKGLLALSLGRLRLRRCIENCRSHRRRQTVVVKIWASNQQSILLGLLGTGPQMLKGRPAQTNRNKGPGRGRSKSLQRGDQAKAMTADGVMGRVRGSRRDPRKDEYGKISRRYRRHNWKDCHLENGESGGGDSKYSTSPKGEERGRDNTLALGELMSTPMVALASPVEMTWRSSMDSFYLGQRGFGDSLARSHAERWTRFTSVKRVRR